MGGRSFYCGALALFASYCFPAHADSLSDIAAFAEKICNQSLSGSEARTTLQGNLNGDVNGLAKALGLSVSAGGLVKKDGTTYEGIPKDKLSDNIPTPAQCKLEVAKALIEERERLAVPKPVASKRNRVLVDTLASDAGAAIDRLRTLQAETRCRRGWDSIMALNVAAVEARRQGDLDSAGDNYEEIGKRATAIAAYFGTRDVMAASMNQTNAYVASLRESVKQSTKQIYSRSLSNFNFRLKDLQEYSNSQRRPVDLKEPLSMISKAAQLAAEDRYQEATDKVIDADNLVVQMLVATGHNATPAFKPSWGAINAGLSMQNSNSPVASSMPGASLCE